MDNDFRKNEQKHNRKVFLITFFIVLAFGAVVLLLIYRKQNSDTNQTATEFESESVTELAGLGDNNNSEDASEEISEEVISEEPSEVYPPEENTILLEQNDNENLVITFAGDVLLDDGYVPMNRYRQVGGDLEQIFTNGLLEYMNAPDVFMVNNEFTFSDRGAPLQNKAFTFRGKPENVEIYHGMGVDIVGMANNHITDWGIDSLYDTLDTIDNAGIARVGAGRNLEEASRIQYYRKGDIKIAIVCATQIERLPNPDTRGATEDGPGTFRCYDPELAIEKIKEAKENSDFVIFYVHWGTERVEEPDWLQTSQIQGYVDAGADAIIGGHPHILQKIGYTDDTLIYYSLGNYWFSSKSTDTGVATLEIGKDGLVSSRFVPCVSQNCVVNMSDGGEKDRILNHMRNISPTVEIDEDGYITKK